MTKYAKLISETQIEFPPKNKGSICNYDTNYDLLIEDGYKEYVPADIDPDTVYSFTYIDLGNKIKQIATEIPQPDPAVVREQQFERDFFETSLGWIRRQVSMSDGTRRDFLSDLFPAIAIAANTGIPVMVLAYNKPDDFSEEITNWTQYQHNEIVTAHFLQECMTRLQNDFIPIN